jgi:hypothetical protein
MDNQTLSRSLTGQLADPLRYLARPYAIELFSLSTKKPFL